MIVPRKKAPCCVDIFGINALFPRVNRLFSYYLEHKYIDSMGIGKFNSIGIIEKPPKHVKYLILCVWVSTHICMWVF